VTRELEKITGVVEARNERGVKLGDTWYNLSRWASDVDEFDVGDEVELGLDSKQFIRTLKRIRRPQRNTQSGQSRNQSESQRGVSDEWVRVQALTLALQYAQVAKLDQITLADLYDIADELEGAIRHGFPAMGGAE
jgi:hypothetical protein